MTNVIVNGVIIGIIAVVILAAFLYTITFQTVMMADDKLAPMIKTGDLVRYEDVPMSKININDLVVYFEGAYRISKVISVGDSYSGPFLEVRDAAGYKHNVDRVEYQGKVSDVIPNVGYLVKNILGFPNGLWLYIIVFISPMIIMKLREKK
jgi:hypothetical protein